MANHTHVPGAQVKGKHTWHHVLRWWMGTQCKQVIHAKTEDVMSSRNSCNFVCPTDKDFRGTMLAPPNCASVVIHCSPPAMASLVSTISTQDDPARKNRTEQSESDSTTNTRTRWLQKKKKKKKTQQQNNNSLHLGCHVVVYNNKW